MQVSKAKKGYKLVDWYYKKQIEIPKEWESKQLVELTEKMGGGGTPSRDNKDFFGGDILWVVIDDITRNITKTSESLTSEGFKNCSSKLWKKGTIILSTGATIGKVGIAGTELCTKQGIVGIVSKKNVDSVFLSYFLGSIKKELNNWADGTTLREIYQNSLKKIKIIIPEFSEQQKIGLIISNIDDALEKTNQSIIKLKSVKKGLMQKLFTTGIGHTKFKKVEWFFGKEIEIPEDWEILSLKKCVKDDAPITYGIVQAGPHIEDGIPYIRTSDMKNDQLSVNNMLRTSKTIAKNFKRSEVKTNELVYAIRATVGKVLSVPPELDGANLTQGTARISPNEKLINDFLLYALQSNYCETQLQRVIKGTTFLEITLAELRKLLIFVPPKPEQQKIAIIIANVNSQINKEKLQKSNLELLKKGLMQKLLTGQIRVKV